METKNIRFNYSGASLSELKEEYGIGGNGFYDNDWWLGEPFAKEKPEAGEYDVKLMPLFDKTFSEQKEEIDKDFEVAHPAIVAEAILSHFKKTGERLCEDWYVRCSRLASDGYRVYVGRFDSDGLHFSNNLDDDRGDDTGISSARKSRNLKPRNVEPLESLSLGNLTCPNCKKSFEVLSNK